MVTGAAASGVQATTAGGSCGVLLAVTNVSDEDDDDVVDMAGRSPGDSTTTKSSPSASASLGSSSGGGTAARGTAFALVSARVSEDVDSLLPLLLLSLEPCLLLLSLEPCLLRASSDGGDRMMRGVEGCVVGVPRNGVRVGTEADSAAWLELVCVWAWRWCCKRPGV